MDFLRLRYQRFHTSYLLLGLALGILVGLLIAAAGLYVGWVGYLLAMSLLLGVFRSKRWWALAIAVVAGGLIGLSRGSMYAIDLSRYDSLVGSAQTVEGTMSGDAQLSGQGATKLTLSDIVINGARYPGEMYATVTGHTVLKRGDRIQLNGTIKEGFATYPIAMSYASVVQLQRGPDPIRDVREQFGRTIRTHVLEPMASLGLGFVVGQRSTLPDSLDEQLKIVGLTHIVVASGYNLTILVRFIMRLFSHHSRYIALTGSLTLMSLFVMFSGFSPSMNRAVVVTTLALLAWYVGRRFHPVYLLLYVAAGTAFANPTYLWADLGWYLSFFAFAGVLVVAPLVVAYLYKKRQPSAVELLVIETLSAEVMALPLIAFSFSVAPVFGLIANVLVAPIIPFAMFVTAVGGLAAMLSPVFGFMLLPATIIIAYVIAVVEWLSSISWAQIAIDAPLWAIIIWYVVVAIICWLIAHRTGYNFRQLDRTSGV